MKDWVIVRDFSLYEINIDGVVRNVKTKRPLKPIDRRGYVTVSLHTGPESKLNRQRFIHRLLWEAFVGVIPEEMQINHKDGVKANNSLANLELVTPKQNIHHAKAMGLHGGDRQGKKAKLTSEQVREIRASSTTRSKYHGWVAEMSARYGITTTSIANVISRRTWKHVL